MRKRKPSKTEQVTWMIVGAGAAMLASTLMDKSMTAGWKAMNNGRPPKKPESPRTSWTEALAWTAASAVAVGLSQILAKRGAALGWKAAVGRFPPVS
jgi:hypothetical protein